MCDAHLTLAEFMTFDGPNWDRFEITLSAEMARLGATQPGALRAYGEMVGILWDARQYGAAVRLEQFWNRLLARHAFSLYCGYSLDFFDSNNGALDAIVHTHTHSLPSGHGPQVEAALRRAIEEVCGPEGEAFAVEARAESAPDVMASGVMAGGEALALWLRRHRPAQAGQILERARQLHSTVTPAPVICSSQLGEA